MHLENQKVSQWYLHPSKSSVLMKHNQVNITSNDKTFAFNDNYLILSLDDEMERNNFQS